MKSKKVDDLESKNDFKYILPSFYELNDYDDNDENDNNNNTPNNTINIVKRKYYFKS